MVILLFCSPRPRFCLEIVACLSCSPRAFQVLRHAFLHPYSWGYTATHTGLQEHNPYHNINCYHGCTFPCVRFLTSLIRAAPTRLGKNGVGEVMASTWLAGFPWERIREVRAPYVTEGAARVKVSQPSTLLSRTSLRCMCCMCRGCCTKCMCKGPCISCMCLA